MRREDSRITLEITGVRIDRLNNISERDAQAEGACRELRPGLSDEFYGYDNHRSYRNGFHILWESINGAESWAANPWVWVIEFKRVNDDR